MDHLDQSDSQDQSVREDHLEKSDHKDHQVLLEYGDQLVRMERMGNRVLPVRREILDPSDQTE